jgi:hypothetical protein
VACLLCGARQTDPVRGASPWKRGVKDGEQVLVCPDCQASGDWTSSLDRCPSCGSASLSKTLGEVVCKACSATGGAVVAARSGAAGASGSVTQRTGGTLRDDVDAALARVLSEPIDPGGRPRRR